MGLQTIQMLEDQYHSEEALSPVDDFEVKRPTAKKTQATWCLLGLERVPALQGKANPAPQAGGRGQP